MGAGRSWIASGKRMIRFLCGVVVGSLGATYLIGMLLPATREERPRDPLPERRYGSGIGVPQSYRQSISRFPNDGRTHWVENGAHLPSKCCGVSDDTWTSGPST